jgi:hypothetical protein
LFIADMASVASDEGSAESAAPKLPKRKVENFASVSSSIMMRLPTKNLGSLRQIFQRKTEGLSLVEFLEAVINNMELPDSNMLMLMVADLVDFFQLVDINGDGHMEWEEFVMFILDAVVPEKDATLLERFTSVGSVVIQPPSSRCSVHCAKLIPSINKIVLGVGMSLHFYAPDEDSPHLSTLVYRMQVADEQASELKPFNIIDISYIESQDILCVVKDNISANFYKLRMPSNISPDTVEDLGVHRFHQAYNRCVFRDVPGQDVRIFTICASKVVDSWKCAFRKWQKPDFTDLKCLSKHTDFIRDIITIRTPQFQYVVTCGMDKVVHFWDLDNLRYKFMRSGHETGIQCLAFDGTKYLFGGGFDFTVSLKLLCVFYRYFAADVFWFVFSDYWLGCYCHPEQTCHSIGRPQVPNMQNRSDGFD